MVMTRFNKQSALIAGGSPNFEYKNAAAIAAGARVDVNVKQYQPKAGIYMPLDSMMIYNNSAQEITVYLNSLAESVTVPSLMIKPINKVNYEFFMIKNNGALPIAIGEILIQMKRLPPDIQQTVNVGR